MPRTTSYARLLGHKMDIRAILRTSSRSYHINIINQVAADSQVARRAWSRDSARCHLDTVAVRRKRFLERLINTALSHARRSLAPTRRTHRGQA
jgi:hypothetical protein